MSQQIEPIGVGMIGAGNFARHQHLPNLMRIPECRLVAVCDVLPDVAWDCAQRFGAKYATTDYRQLLEDPSIGVVVIAVRDDLQAEFSAAAMRAGKHVYVEKPLASSPEACETVLVTQQETGCRLAVGFNRRYAPIYRATRDVIARDGGPHNVHLHMADDAWRWAKGYPPGYLLTLDMGHFFDLLRWLSGAEIASVYCSSSRPDDDCMAIRLTNGCVASILFSGHGTMDMPKERTDIITERGGITAEDFVELRTFGYADIPAVQTFPGHSHPEGEFMHKYLMQHVGAEGWRALRRATWEARQQVEAHPDDQAPDAVEMRRYVERTVPNFLRDQGWLASLRAFIVGVATGEPTEHAGPGDALAAVRASRAALESRETGEVVKVAAPVQP